MYQYQRQLKTETKKHKLIFDDERFECKQNSTHKYIYQHLEIQTEYYAALTHFKNNISGLKYLCQLKLASFPHSFTILAATMLTKQSKGGKQRSENDSLHYSGSGSPHLHTFTHRTGDTNHKRQLSGHRHRRSTVQSPC